MSPKDETSDAAMEGEAFERANDALGPLELECRKVHTADEDLPAFLAALNSRRQSVVMQLAAGEHVRPADRAVTFRTADGCWESWMYDFNNGRVCRRRFPGKPRGS